jgi:hypothetical protein
MINSIVGFDELERLERCLSHLKCARHCHAIIPSSASKMNASDEYLKGTKDQQILGFMSSRQGKDDSTVARRIEIPCSRLKSKLPAPL